jgi:hypothetical protein
MFPYYVFYASTDKLARVHVGHCRHCIMAKDQQGGGRRDHVRAAGAARSLLARKRRLK